MRAPRDAALAALLTASLSPATSLAQRARYARPDELQPEGTSYQVDLSMRAGYARVLDPARVGGLTNIGAFGLHTRQLVGRRVAWFSAFDGEVGGGESGVVYGASLHPAGLALRWGEGNFAALHGGLGVSGAPGAIPFAMRVPAGFTLAQSLGPVRLSLWASLAWTPIHDARQKGSSWLSIADEVEAGLSMRIGRQRPYWSSVSAGAGPSINLTYREFMGTRSLGVSLGFDLSGAR